MSATLWFWGQAAAPYANRALETEASRPRANPGLRHSRCRFAGRHPQRLLAEQCVAVQQRRRHRGYRRAVAMQRMHGNAAPASGAGTAS